MQVVVKLFAGLREQYGFAEQQLSFPETAAEPLVKPVTVEHVWQHVTQQQTVPANLLAAINYEYVDLSAPVNDADEIAFFPPVTGG